MSRDLPSVLAHAFFALSMICGSYAAKNYYVTSVAVLPALNSIGSTDESALRQSVLAGLEKDEHGELTRRFVEFQAREVKSNRDLWLQQTKIYCEFARNQAIGWFVAVLLSLALVLVIRSRRHRAG